MNDARTYGNPQPGYFKLRAWRAGPWLPARIVEDLPLSPEGEIMEYRTKPRYVAEINGLPADLENVWTYGRPIAQEEYEWLRALAPMYPRKPPPQ